MALTPIGRETDDRPVLARVTQIPYELLYLSLTGFHTGCLL